MRDGTGRLQRVVLLGGTSEIGLALMSNLQLVPGATVVLAGRDSARLAAAAAALPADVHVECVGFDAARPETHAALFDQLFTEDVDVVVTAFGVLPDQREAEREPMRATDSFTVNLTGHVSALLHAAQRMRTQGHGDLVVFSSVAAVRARRANYVYGAAKAGLDAFASGLADALHGSGVRLLLVRPGFVRGRMTHGMRTAPLATTPERVGAVTAAALHKGRSVVWVPQPLAILSLAIRCTPRSIWRRLSF